MLRLKANKTSLYRLVRLYESNVGGFRHCEFHKAFRRPDYSLDWCGGGLSCHAFFSACGGKALLSIEKSFDGKQVDRKVFTLDLENLRERGMIEEVPER